MANSKAVATRTENAFTIENWVESENIKQKFREVLDKGAGAFVTSILSLVKSTRSLRRQTPRPSSARQ